MILGIPVRFTVRGSLFWDLKGRSGESIFPGSPMTEETADEAASARERPSGSVVFGAGGTGVYSGSGLAVFFFCAAEA